MTKLAFRFISILTMLLIFPSTLSKVFGQASAEMYVCGKDFCKPFPLGNASNISFRNDYTIINGRRFYNADIDSIAFQKPDSPYLYGLGETETQTAIAGAAILDITARIGEDETKMRNVYSAWYMLNVAGIPFETTTDLTQALSTSRMIVVSSPVDSMTFTDSELQAIIQWVDNGGTLVISAATPKSNTALAKLVGYGKAVDFSQRKEIDWNLNLADKPEFDYIDTDEERTTLLGRNADIRSYHFDKLSNDADTLATIPENGWIAAVRHRQGKGTVYSYGSPWGLLIQYVQTGKDTYKRSKNNNFEPSADVIPLQLRSIYCHQSSTPAVWKFTIPNGYESVLIPTHDCDSKTALDSMYFMSDYEKTLGAKCHYFITTHYYAEPQDTGEIRLGFGYTQDRIPKIRKLIADGHTVGSHSVGHFPDFDNVSRFPMTIVKDTADYHPMYSNRTKSTTGGSTWAEINISKNLLEGDLHNVVKSFRTGHLCMNDSIPRAEQMGSIKFASCYTAHDMRSEFPFQERLGNTADGDFNGVLEMPLHFSDVFNGTGAIKMDASNWQDKVEIWKGIHKKLANNYAPAIILIHPNREWKMESEKMLVDSYNRDKIGIYNFEDYGKFWNTRSNTNFTYGYDKDKNVITIHLLKKIDDYGMLPFAIENISSDNLPTVHLTDPDNKIVAIGQLKGTETTGRYICVF